MVSEPHDWTVPAPLRALLWWPPLAFLLALLQPTAAVWTIAVAGAVLAVLGVVAAGIGRSIARRRAAGGAAEPALTVPAVMETVVPTAAAREAA